MFSIAQSVFSILHHLSIVRNENRSFKYIRFAPFINCIVVILAYGKLHERSIINNSNKKRSCAKKMFSSSFLLKIKINKGLLKVNQSAYSGGDRDDFFKPSLWYLLFFFHFVFHLF
jgi:membrane-associated HD superfamily phosphohydrolase